MPALPTAALDAMSRGRPSTLGDIIGDPAAAGAAGRFREPAGIRLGVVRGISYGLFGKPDDSVAAAASTGAGLVRTYLYWSQVEPEPGRFVWDTVDAMLDQIPEGQELWITLCSSSRWGTRRSTDFQPQSPAIDNQAYRELVRRTVAHCAGRVRYWQCNNEPSNTDALWDGTAAEYVTELMVMHAAVREADRSALVVLGGCGYDVLSSPPGSPPRLFFDHVIDAGRDHYDLFSVHLYGPAATVPADIATVRAMMQTHGYLKPVVVGEYAGPVPFQYPQAEAAMQDALTAAFTEPAPDQSVAGLAEGAGTDTPERRAMAVLYRQLPDLPPQLQMFMAGCPAELEAKRHRINSREVVTRAVLALSAGVRRATYWDLAPEIAGWSDHLTFIDLMFGKLFLLDYRGGRLDLRYPAADALTRFAGLLDGATTVAAATVHGPDSVRSFRISRERRGDVIVIWDERDPFTGEDLPPTRIDLPWPARTAYAVDAFGQEVTTRVGAGAAQLVVTPTPVYLAATRHSGLADVLATASS